MIDYVVSKVSVTSVQEQDKGGYTSTVIFTLYYTNTTSPDDIQTQQNLITNTLNDAIETSDLTRSIRLASRQSSNALDYVVICSSLNSTSCFNLASLITINPNTTTLTSSSCSRDTLSWQQLYTPGYLAVILCFIAIYLGIALKLSLTTLLLTRKETYTLWMPAIIASMLLRLVYFLNIFSKSLAAVVAEEAVPVACIEFSFLSNTSPDDVIWRLFVALYYPMMLYTGKNYII
jgi:hypothetical protein